MGVVSRTALVALSAALFVGCAAAEPVVPPAELTGSSPVPFAPVPFAPYVDVTSKHPSLASAVAAAPVRRIVLAFALAKESRCDPAWGGNLPVNDAALRADIAAVRAAGGAVSVATGGASGTYLENSCDTAAALVDAYSTALSATGADRLDVDVEAEMPVDLVADALTSARRELGVEVTVTAVVADSVRGFKPSTVSLLRALAKRGSDVTVNAMLMNFRAGNNWRDSLIAAAETVTGQVSQVWPGGGRSGAYRRVGLTLMAGRNDTGVVTTVEDASAVRDYARTHQIGSIGFWSLGRDNGDCPGRLAASPRCSGISQAPYAFTRALS
jgi:chitinase